MIWNLQSYSTTVVNERVLHFRWSKHTLTPPIYFQGVRRTPKHQDLPPGNCKQMRVRIRLGQVVWACHVVGWQIFLALAEVPPLGEGRGEPCKIWISLTHVVTLQNLFADCHILLATRVSKYRNHNVQCIISVGHEALCSVALYIKISVVRLRASCGAVYCNMSCLWVCLFVCGYVTTITRNCDPHQTGSVWWPSPAD